MSENQVNNPKRHAPGSENKKIEMKRLKYSGLAYHNRSNKDIAAKKAPSFEVFCKCKYECRKLPYEQKIFLFEDYYKIANHVKQKSYLLGLIQIGSVKRSHGKYESAEQSRRQATAWYTVPNGNGQHVKHFQTFLPYYTRQCKF
ncbi:unnamed protein product [Acanthoscelides obtectus]|uniref:Uncharacterized protein n=1 Tax=Acanthoscelides obtectus TaxID=200917 RepID=A0A9P0LGV4_ACAOB|nr:unnamed protein product [Acanthoscelides obtectus]CAK1627345.1 hypothetical protein AOBTE_LOCUS4538 [Acanthoscelides obtectus]